MPCRRVSAFMALRVDSRTDTLMKTRRAGRPRAALAELPLGLAGSLDFGVGLVERVVRAACMGLDILESCEEGVSSLSAN